MLTVREEEEEEDETIESSRRRSSSSSCNNNSYDMNQFLQLRIASEVRARRGTENVSREMPVEEDTRHADSRLSHEHREQIDNRLRGRRCEVNGEQPTAGAWMAPSARQWLQAASLGQDLMSDHDSPTSKASLSRTVWRSMGQWRLSAEEPRIFLECRAPSKCLGKSDAKWAHLGYEGMLLETARAIHRFEHA
ncbi:gpmB [Symbiodinium sp. CCMP2592]|nr:gpmB [Symbiodinium sp. CCMP2592]